MARRISPVLGAQSRQPGCLSEDDGQNPGKEGRQTECEKEAQMSGLTEVAVAETAIVMSRVYDAPRGLVWQAMTRPEHIRRWWGGPGFTNPVCEMDVRPGGLWHHVMRFPDGHELHLDFVFLEVEPPSRLVWRHVDHGMRKQGPPTCRTTVTLDDLGGRTRGRAPKFLLGLLSITTPATDDSRPPASRGNEGLARANTMNATAVTPPAPPPARPRNRHAA